MRKHRDSPWPSPQAHSRHMVTLNYMMMMISGVQHNPPSSYAHLPYHPVKLKIKSLTKERHYSALGI